MLTFAMIKPLGGILKRIDVASVMEAIQEVDLQQPTAAEQAGRIILTLVLPKVEDVADDLTRLCATYKGVTYDEALKLNAIGTIKELFSEAGFVDFFKRAAQSASLK